MYHHSFVYLAGEPVGPEVRELASRGELSVRFGLPLTFVIDGRQALELVAALTELLSPLELDAPSCDQMTIDDFSHRAE